MTNYYPDRNDFVSNGKRNVPERADDAASADSQRNHAKGALNAWAFPRERRLLVLVRLSSERARQEVRQDRSFGTKQTSRSALRVVVRSGRVKFPDGARYAVEAGARSAFFGFSFNGSFGAHDGSARRVQSAWDGQALEGRVDCLCECYASALRPLAQRTASVVIRFADTAAVLGRTHAYDPGGPVGSSDSHRAPAGSATWLTQTVHRSNVDDR